MFSFQKLPLRVVASYVFDYGLIVFFAIVFAVVDKIDPYHQHFSLNNYTLQYPYAVKERIPVWLLCILVIAAPAGIIAIFTFFIDGLFSHSRPRRQPYTIKERLWEFNCGLLGLLLAVGAAFTITGTLKNAIGKPRPDIIDRCQPRPGSQDASTYGLSDISICTQTDDYILQDGFRSFPSGHSSCSFAGLYFLSLYIAAKLHVLDSKGEVWKTVLVMIPTLAAALIAGTRIMDARHHPFDVISGAMLGVLVGWASYRQYFPAVSDCANKGRAHPIRSWGKQEPGYLRSTDDQLFVPRPLQAEDRVESGLAGASPQMGISPADMQASPGSAAEKPMELRTAYKSPY